MKANSVKNVTSDASKSNEEKMSDGVEESPSLILGAGHISHSGDGGGGGGNDGSGVVRRVPNPVGSSSSSSSPPSSLPSFPCSVRMESATSPSSNYSTSQARLFMASQAEMIQTAAMLHQIKQTQLLQRQLLDQQYQRRKDMMRSQHEVQLTDILQQAQLQNVPEEAPTLHVASCQEADRSERLRLEILKQKSRHDQSAVASPEVKRHLQEFVLQKRRKEASTTSMGNLKLVPVSLPPSGPILRKTASESNLLKMKSKRNTSDSRVGASPYQRAHPVIPESAVLSGTASANSSPPVELNSPSTSSTGSCPGGSAIAGGSTLNERAQLTQASVAGLESSDTLSSKYGPQNSRPFGSNVFAGLGIQTRQHLSSNSSSASTLLNSKSLPNIPSAVGRFSAAKEGIFKRKSPPPHLGSGSNSSSGAGMSKPLPHHGAMIVRRSKSSAILPLRKHLIEKSLNEQKLKSMDEEQFYFQQKQIARERVLIRPIEEVMEEDVSKFGDGGNISDNMDFSSNEVQAEDRYNDCFQQPYNPSYLRHAHSFTARLGPSGLSPLVLSEVTGSPNTISNDYVTKLLPRQPLDLVMSSKGDLNSQDVMIGKHIKPAFEVEQSGIQTGLGFDHAMLQHECTCKSSSNHPEHPGRILSIWNRLTDVGLVEKCVRIARSATLEEIQTCHSEIHSLVYGTDMVNRCSLTGSQELNRDTRIGKFSSLECGGTGVDADTYWNELETPLAVRAAVGSMVELSQKVARGQLRNGFAIIRPPGHHAEFDEAMGFCYFNSIAIAAKQLLREPSVKKILILDWAIHHGNGTQKVFYDDPDVLFVSLHRHDNGNFYPGTGGPVECGTGAGLGFNINIAWSGGLDPPMADAEYLAAFRSVIMPIASDFNPDIVLVSSGFDAAAGHPHPMGGYVVSTACFAYMTRELRKLARGKLILALEGGFNLEILANASEQCLRALLGLPIEKIEETELARRPSQSAMDTLQKTLAIQLPYWEILRGFSESAILSHLEAWEKNREESESTVKAMAHLSVHSSQAPDLLH